MKELQNLICYEFKNKKLLKESLTHRSTRGKKNNERLEFLGDAVLDLVVAQHLFNTYPNNEGDMSKMRANIVNGRSLAEFANSIELSKFIRISHAEDINNGRHKASILADAFEAMMGAVYLDSDLATTSKVFMGIIKRAHKDLAIFKTSNDYKTTLQEFTHEHFKKTPKYILRAQDGPDHDMEFKVELLLDGKSVAIGNGKSKKKAEQDAAKIALNRLKTHEQL